MDGTQNHYETLGVHPSAGDEEIRRAYRGLARALHPDRHQHEGRERAEAANRRMSELNVAWGVLSDPEARARYDRMLSGGASRVMGGSPPPAGGPPPASRTSGGPTVRGPMPASAGFEGHRVVRGVLWLVMLGVLGAIFVFTAYAAGGGGDPAEGPVRAPSTTMARLRRDDCVDMAPGSIEPVPCSGTHEARVVDLVPIGRPCPAATREVYLPDQQESACIGAP